MNNSTRDSNNYVQVDFHFSFPSSFFQYSTSWKRPSFDTLVDKKIHNSPPLDLIVVDPIALSSLFLLDMTQIATPPTTNAEPSIVRNG